MKKIYILLAFFISHLGTLAQSNYNGNSNGGFSGAIGTSTLSVSDDGTNINFTLTRGSGLLNDIFVVYFSSKTGGFTSTTPLTDAADDHRRAITGKPGGGTSNIDFPTGFDADYAISIGTSYAGFWELNSGSLVAVSSLGTPPTNNFTTFNFSLTKTQLGVTGSTIAFDLIGTYISGSSFRSNEGYGGGFTGSNPGWSNVTMSSFFTYPLVIAPLFLSNFSGSVKNETIELKWATRSESNLDKFILQKSNNGLNFTDLAEVAPKNIVTGASYNYVDVNPIFGNNFYRIIARNNTGDKAYSNIIKINYGKIDNTLTLFPNPTREFLKINFMNAVRGNYSLDIFNDAGQRLITQKFDHNGIDRILSITLPTSMKKGPYRVHISNGYEFYKGTFIVQ